MNKEEKDPRKNKTLETFGYFEIFSCWYQEENRIKKVKKVFDWKISQKMLMSTLSPQMQRKVEWKEVSPPVNGYDAVE